MTPDRPPPTVLIVEDSPQDQDVIERALGRCGLALRVQRRTDGREVPQELKSSESPCSIPVVVPTTSGHERDVQACCRAGANRHVQKPVDLASVIDAAGRVVQHWPRVATLPGGLAHA